jgi:filamentous hemagglutinin family protein
MPLTWISKSCASPRSVLAPLLLFAFALATPLARANPTGGTPTQGTATFSTSGSTLTIQTSDRAAISWQSFNIGVGETTTFVQPSSSSVVWNRINDPNPSQILGNLNANGFVVLQNPNGLYIGGQALISTHGLLLTTSPIPVPDLASGGPWQFNAPPPTASIVNYGKINVDSGGSLFLISHEIDNQGTLSAPAGNIGLYAGQEVLVSDRPDGRGLSAQVKLPEGSVNNAGSIVADAGTIAMHARVVNQGGLVQADSVRAANGVIELVASDSLNLEDSSVISAKGTPNPDVPSPGGFVILKSGNAFVDTASSSIKVAGANGGVGGIVEVLCSAVSDNPMQSSIESPLAVLINPYDISISTDSTDASSTYPTLNAGDLAHYSQIRLEATDNIEFKTSLTLPDITDGSGWLSLNARNNITLDNATAIIAGRNWNLNIMAGTGMTSAADRTDGSDGIYLFGNAYIQTQNGSINLWAGNELQINPGGDNGSGDVGNNGIRTQAGGSISVQTLYGDVNTGGNYKGFRTPYRTSSPFYSPLTTLGGISTVAGGDVSIDAGGNVISFLPSGNDPSVAGDGGAGAFGRQPGNVSIHAGGSVFGHFVLANGTGTITAGQDAGGSDPSQNLALSLIKGAWTVNAPNGNIYLQEVRNPNGVFNAAGNNPNSPAYHAFDYDPHSAVSLNAGNGVYLTGLNLPRTTDPAPPMIFPPTLNITAGADGIVLGDSIILFPSQYGNLHITDAGRFEGVPNNPAANPTPSLIMSDSSQTQWADDAAFGISDHGAIPTELNNPDPVMITVGGTMKNLILVTSKQTWLTIGGNLEDCSFSGQNLHADDITSIDVAGQILNRSPYSFTLLQQDIPLIPANLLPPRIRATWASIFALALDPVKLADMLPLDKNLTVSQLADKLSSIALFLNNPGFFYNPKTHRLGFNGQMSDSVRALMEQPLTVVRYGKDGLPMVDSSGHFVTTTVSWGVAGNAIDALYQDSQGRPSSTSPAGLGYEVGGPGSFGVRAGSISLGNTYGILATGVGDQQGNHRFANLAPYTPVAASLNVTVDGNLEMSASTIANLGGGPVTVTSRGGSMTLGSQDLAGLQQRIIQAHGLALGIFASGDADVNVTAHGDINIDSSRIASYNGGNISVLSQHGNIDAGSGSTILTPVVNYFVDASGAASAYHENVSGSGILATTLADPSQVPGSPLLPGNIAVTTPQGNIVANLGGILQTVQNGTLTPGPTVTLSAGSPGYIGNIQLGNSGVVGGTVTVDASGNVTGLVISKQDAIVNAAGNFSGTVMSGGTANLSAGGGITGTIIGIGGVNASGGAGVSANVFSQNASVNGGASESTLGTSTSATSAAQSASQQSSSDAKQVASSDQKADDKPKSNRKSPTLVKRSRVTVILPKA